MSINTLAAARTLEETGMPEEQAEAVVEIVRQSEGDERRTKIEDELVEIKGHLGKLEARLGSLEARVDTGMKFLMAIGIGIFIMIASAWITYIIS